MRIVVMYTRRNIEDKWFNTLAHSEYGIAVRAVTKTNRVESVDGLTLWEFVEISDVGKWRALRDEHIAIREVEFSRKKSLGISTELIELDDGLGDEFFEFLETWDGTPKMELGRDIDISKFFW